MGKANWRSERISVEKLLDDLRVGVKGQSSWEIARTPRNAFRGSVVIKSVWGMPRLLEAKKDVVSCEKSRGFANEN